MINQIINFRLFLTMLAIAATGTFARADVKVTGTVSDIEGPLVGVSIRVQDSPSIYAVTDIDGNYSINVPSRKSNLLFSCVGYTTVMEPVGKGPKLT